MLIEQIVFAWSDAEGQPGYRLLGRSEKIHAADASEIAAWGPEHGAVASPRDGAISYDCHPLASGAFCIGRTSSYSVRVPRQRRSSDAGVLSLYTHCLVIPADEALRYARHFPLILHAAELAGAFRFGAEPPENMQPLAIDHFQLAGIAGTDSLFAAQSSGRAIAARNQPAAKGPASSSLAAEPAEAPTALRQAHASHQRLGGPDETASRTADLSQLDAAVDAAIEGDDAALKELASLWTAAERQCEPSFIEESRERYLRRASSVWTDYLNDAQNRGRSLASIEVLCLLLDV